MDEALIDRLRSDLETAGYRLDRVRGMLGEAAERARERGVLAPAALRLGLHEESALRTLIEVFLLGASARETALDRALPSLGCEGALRLGLIREHQTEAYRAALSLNPVTIPSPHDRGDGATEEWWILSDLDDHLRRAPARPDHVMGVGGATRSLLAQAPWGRYATVFGPDAALDLGTGCGVVAMYLARAGARRVVATDISERALMLARANVRLNGIGELVAGDERNPWGDGEIEFRAGSLFAPVAGERFGLILSNPPFVITPRSGDGVPLYEYRDGGMTGDDLARAVVQGAPAHLERGGTLICLANWEQPWGGDGLERVREWIEGAPHGSDTGSGAGRGHSGGLAGWVVERERLDPARYAETWARDGGARPGDPEFDALLAAWLADFESRRVVAVGLGSIRVQRLDPGADAAVVRVEQAAEAFAESPGPALARAFQEGVAAERMSDEAALATRWIRDPAVVEIREHDPGAEDPRAISLRTDRPISRTVTADPLLAAAIGACDGELTLGQIADALATLLDVDADAAAEALLAGVRELAWLGMVAAS